VHFEQFVDCHGGNIPGPVQVAADLRRGVANLFEAYASVVDPPSTDLGFSDRTIAMHAHDAGSDRISTQSLRLFAQLFKVRREGDLRLANVIMKLRARFLAPHGVLVARCDRYRACRRWVPDVQRSSLVPESFGRTPDASEAAATARASRPITRPELKGSVPLQFRHDLPLSGGTG
jgi:hypothetical protein